MTEQPYAYLRDHKDSATVTWTGITSGDTCQAFEIQDWKFASVTATGTFGNTLTITGSNDNSTYFNLRDMDGADLTFAANGIGYVYDILKYVKPSLAAGGTSNVTVIIYLVR